MKHRGSKKSVAPDLGTLLESSVRALLDVARELGRSEGELRRHVRKALERRVLPSPAERWGPRLVERWARTAPYRYRGKPRPLPFTGKVSFASLVRDARAGKPEETRRALLRAGLVRERPDGTLELLASSFVPGRGTPEQLGVAIGALAEFFRLLAHNVTGRRGTGLLQRFARYDNIGSRGIPRVSRALEKTALGALERANRLLASVDRDRNPRAPKGRKTRVTFGVYCFVDPPPRRGKR